MNINIKTRVHGGLLALLVSMLFLFGASPAYSAQHITVAVPAVPPVWSGLFVYVAKDQGFYKKNGLDVKARPFPSGAGAARAVIAGSIPVALAPTPPVVKMVSNAGAPLVGIWGMAHPDWLLGSMNPHKSSCKDLKGASVGVDSVGGARYIQLLHVLHHCGLSTKDVNIVSLSSGVGAAMIAGQLNFGILHTDDVTVIQRKSGKKLTIVARIRKIDPGASYNLFVTRPTYLKRHRKELVHLLAANIEAVRFMNDPKNFKRVAEIARKNGVVNSGVIADGEKDIRRFVNMEYWPTDDDGMSRSSVQTVINTQEKVGGIKKGKTPVSYDRLVNKSIWKAAYKQLKGK